MLHGAHTVVVEVRGYEDLPHVSLLRNRWQHMSRGALAFALAAGLAVGCNNTTSTREETAPPVATAVVRPSVAWPSASSVDARALSMLVDARSEREIKPLIARSPVPVLAPRELRLASPTLVVEGEYFALTGRAGGATVSLQGTRAAHRYEGIEPVSGNRDVRGTRGFVSSNEGIRTASWIENGAAYTVDVECAEASDERCRSDAFVLEVVEQLAFVGGSGR